MTISLANVYSRGVLTDAGHSERDCDIAGTTVGFVLLMVAGVATVYLCSSYFHNASETMATITVISMAVGYFFGLLLVASYWGDLYRPLPTYERERFVLIASLEKPEPIEHKEKVVPVEEAPFEKPLLSRVKSVLGCCFYKVIKDGSLTRL